MKNNIDLERRRILDVAKKYLNDGYQVILEPENMPEFLGDLKPDLVALSENDNVIVEVSISNLTNDNRLKRFAKSVENLKNWRFEIISSKSPILKNQNISIEDIKNRLQEAEQIINVSPVASLLLTWSATETILREIVISIAPKTPPLSPVTLVKTLFSLGELSRSSYEIFDIAAKIRNDAVHGFNLKMPSSISSLDQLNNQLIFHTTKVLSLFVDGKKKKRTPSVDELVNWFYDKYEDPANGVPYESKEGGYIYIFGGPYDPYDELREHFDDVKESILDKAANEIYKNGSEWIKKGQY